jgi:hypothetical protein
VRVVREFLIAPRVLPDGAYVWDEQYDDEIGVRLRDGDATLGWEGDERLSLVCNVKERRWEVWRHCEDGTDRRIMWRDGLRKPGPEVLRHLAWIDTHHHDVLGRVEDTNARLVRERRAQLSDFLDDAGDRLHHAFVKDLGIPAADGRVVAGYRAP